MTIIAIDSSGPVAGIAIYKENTLLAEYNVVYKKKHSQTLLPMLSEAAEMVEVSMDSVDAIAVTAGPGSFTGLRIGSAMAKGLACAIKKPIIPVPTLDSLAWNMFGVSGIICPIMDARREQVYNALYRFEGGKLVKLTEQRAIAMREVMDELNKLGEKVTFLGDGVPVYKEIIEEMAEVEYQFAPASHDRQKAASVGALAVQLFEEGASVSADTFNPIYLRQSQPEQAKKEGKA